MERLGKELKEKQEQFKDPHRNVSREFQIYGYELAEKLDDLHHKALYIKLAKEEPRSRLEEALSFTSDYPNAGSKGKIFMYKLKQLRELSDQTNASN